VLGQSLVQTQDLLGECLSAETGRGHRPAR
jgi:hypothetical protein